MMRKRRAQATYPPSDRSVARQTGDPAQRRYDQALGRVLQRLEDTEHALEALLRLEVPPDNEESDRHARGLTWLLEIMRAGLECHADPRCWPRRMLARLHTSFMADVERSRS